MMTRSLVQMVVTAGTAWQSADSKGALAVPVSAGKPGAAAPTAAEAATGAQS